MMSVETFIENANSHRNGSEVTEECTDGEVNGNMDGWIDA